MHTATTHHHTHSHKQQTLALHLIEGVIDEVDGSVQVSWVQPRILTLPQVRRWLLVVALSAAYLCGY